MLKVSLVLAMAAAINCVIYDGSCPTTKDFKIHQNFSCNNIFGGKDNFKILGHLPTTNSSLNLFHNPMGAIDDLEVQLMCMHFNDQRLSELETVKFFMSCNDTTKVNSKFSFGCNYKSLNLTSNSWDVIKYDGCENVNFWNSVNIVNYVKHLYAVLWGCRNLSNNKHEQGAWILGYKNNFTEASKLLNQAFFVDLNFTKSSAKDYILYNQTYSGKTTACTYKVCGYNLLCKNDDHDSDENDE